MTIYLPDKQNWEYQIKTDNDNLLGKSIKGMVYKGLDKNNNPIACKIISANELIWIDNKELKLLLELCQNNYQKNLVQLKYFAATQNKTYLVMEYCAGGTLEQQNQRKLQQRQKGDMFSSGYKLEEINNIFRQLVEAYKVLYDAGIIHRDLKPKNIRIEKDTYKIDDLGFARKLPKVGENATMTTGVGTPFYSAPQLILNEKSYDSRCDVWSLGIILYELVFGCNPYGNINSIDQLYQMLSEKHNFPKPTSYCPIELWNWISGMLCFKQEERISWEQIYKCDILGNQQQGTLQGPKIKFSSDQTVTQLQQQPTVLAHQQSAGSENIQNPQEKKNRIKILYQYV